MIYWVGDLHCKEKSPFFERTNKFIDWLKEKITSNDTLVLFGDITDTNHPTPIEVDQVYKLILECGAKQTIIIQGNHDIKRSRTGLDIFQSFKNIECIYYPKEIEIEGKKVLCLPHYESKQSGTYLDMKKDYSPTGIVFEKFGKNDYDYIIGHFSNKPTFGSHIDISHFFGKKVLMGHEHIQREDYIGTPYITRFDEKGKKSYIGITNEDNFKLEEVPKFLDYYTIQYGDQIKYNPYEGIYDIEDCPDKESAMTMYSNYFIHKIKLKNAHVHIKSEKQESTKKTIKEYLSLFIDKQQFPKPLEEKVVSVFQHN